MTTDKAISIVVPTYKERENIGLLVERIHTNLNGHNYEVVIIDDNSNDGSAELVAALSQKYPVRIIVRTNKRGLASAVVDGVAQSESENVIVMDADLQHPPEVLPEIVKALQTHDFVMASRYVKGGSPGKWTLSRRIVSFVANLMALPLAYKINDRMSGFFGFKRAVVNTESLSPTGWKIGLEILVRSKFKSPTEVPFTFTTRAYGESKLSQRIIMQYLQQLIDLYSFKYQILNFMVVGGIGTVINLGLYSILTLIPALKVFAFERVGDTYYVPPFIISSLVAIVCNYLMNKASTFKGWKEQKGGFGRYLAMGLLTLIPDTGLLIVFVQVFHIHRVLSAALAILIMFLVRFLIARTWIWKKNPRKNQI
jgi:dolichol-phosphate mannosyltransferase